jgi:hypothetical protein
MREETIDPRVMVNFRMEQSKVERLRNAIFWIGRGLTINGIMEQAAEKALLELEKKHNSGRPFKDRTAELAKSGKKPAGRRPKLPPGMQTVTVRPPVPEE